MRTTLLTAVLLVGAIQASPPPELASGIAHARSDITASVPAAQQAALLARLDRAHAALDSRRSYLAAYLMESAYESAGAFAFASASGVTSFDSFLKAWTSAGVPAVHGATGSERPAIVEAIAAAAEGRAPATYQASRPYAEDAGVDAGVYYLGESRAQIAFATFARSIPWPAAGPRPAFRSIAPEIAAFDAEMTTKYETMEPASHPTYIQSSAALKQARSLDDAGAHEAALFEYLLSRYLFAPLRGPAAGDPDAARIAAARASLHAGEDHSIAELFLQLADEGVSGNVPAQRRGAAAVLDDILPSYFAAVAPSSLTVATAAPAQVTITLVRWPFT